MNKPLAASPSIQALPRRSAEPAPNVQLHIGSLALPGYTAREGARLAGAFEQELGRLLALQAPLLALQQSMEADLLRIPRFRRSAAESPERTGQRLARALIQGLPR